MKQKVPMHQKTTVKTFELKGEIAVVTGASSGIGAAIAKHLSDLGMKVILLARRLERLKALCQELNQYQANQEQAIAYQLDLRNTDDIEKLFAEIYERFGPIRVLVNNAGLGHFSPLSTGKTEDWRETLEVNILAPSVCTREAIQHMRKHDDWGQIVHISSMSAHRVPQGSGMYSASKFALRSLTEGLRKELRELGSEIRVGSISPGFVETEFAAHFHRSEEKANEIYTQYRVLDPNDIANALVYLLTQPAHVQVHDLLIRPTAQEN